MKKYLLLIFCILFPFTAFCQVDTSQQIVPGRENSAEQQNKPYVILISADGFRYDYAKMYHAQHLLDLAASGVQAESMRPSFPSVTFPNHYTIVTGLYPSHEGLVGNSFYDVKTKSFFLLSCKKCRRRKVVRWRYTALGAGGTAKNAKRQFLLGRVRVAGTWRAPDVLV
jgi:predicted AlkP superfamily pyrophosphatase or phosphodiesterase